MRDHRRYCTAGQRRATGKMQTRLRSLRRRRDAVGMPARYTHSKDAPRIKALVFLALPQEVTWLHSFYTKESKIDIALIF
jgi:hypothetical protein